MPSVKPLPSLSGQSRKPETDKNKSENEIIKMDENISHIDIKTQKL